MFFANGLPIRTSTRTETLGLSSSNIVERLELVFWPVFKTGNGRIKPPVAGSIPALSAMQQSFVRCAHSARCMASPVLVRRVATR